MARWLGAFLLLGCAASGAAAAQSQPSWQRSWTVSAFDCPACSPEDRAWLQARLGEVVTIEPSRFLNPLYESCPSGPDYSDIRPRDRGAAMGFLGSARLPETVADAPLAGSIRCAEPSGPPNTAARIVIDGQRAFMLHESGAIIELR